MAEAGERCPIGETFRLLCHRLVAAAREGNEARKERVLDTIVGLEAEFPDECHREQARMNPAPFDPTQRPQPVSQHSPPPPASP